MRTITTYTKKGRPLILRYMDESARTIPKGYLSFWWGTMYPIFGGHKSFDEAQGINVPQFRGLTC